MSLRVGHDEITFRVSGEESGGSLVAAEVRLPVGGGPPVMHRHASHELYRVEDGEVAIYLAGPEGAVDRVAAGPGDVVHIAGGQEHTVRNESDAPARAYVVLVPGGEMEGFVRAAAKLGEPAVEDVLALAERWGVELTRPVPV